MLPKFLRWWNFSLSTFIWFNNPNDHNWYKDPQFRFVQHEEGFSLSHYNSVWWRLNDPVYKSRKLRPGYAEQSSRRNPIFPETVVVSDHIINTARCVGEAVIDGKAGWLAFKVPGVKLYYFQYQTW